MLNNIVTIFEKQIIDNVPTLTGIIMIKKEDIESYADYWLEQETKHSEPENNINKLIDKLLEGIQ